MHFWGKAKKKSGCDSRDMRSTFDRDKDFLQPSASDLSLQVVLKLCGLQELPEIYSVANEEDES